MKNLFALFRNTDAEKRRHEDVASLMLAMIKEQHDRVGTFVVKIRTPKKTGQGFDMEAHKKRAAAKAAATKCAGAANDAPGQPRPATGPTRTEE